MLRAAIKERGDTPKASISLTNMLAKEECLLPYIQWDSFIPL